MSRILFFLNIFVILMGPVIIILGHVASAGHMIFGFLYAIILTAAAVLTMFYFITTGSSIKHWVNEHNLDQQYYQKTRLYKKQLFPFIFMSAVFAVAAGIYGGGVDMKMEPAWLHGTWAYLSWGLFSFSFMRFVKYGKENRELMVEVKEKADQSVTSEAAAKDVS